MLPNPLEEERLSGEASWGGGASASGGGRGRAWRGAGRERGRAGPHKRVGSRATACRERNEGGVGNEPSAELGKGTELRSEMCSGDQGVQAGAHTGHVGQGGQGGQCSASAGEEARNSGGAAGGRSGARTRGRNPPSSEEEGAAEGAGEGAREGAAEDTGEAEGAADTRRTPPQWRASSPHRDAGQIQLAVNRKHWTILDIPLSLNLKNKIFIHV